MQGMVIAHLCHRALLLIGTTLDDSRSHTIDGSLPSVLRARSSSRTMKLTCLATEAAIAPTARRGICRLRRELFQAGRMTSFSFGSAGIFCLRLDQTPMRSSCQLGSTPFDQFVVTPYCLQSARSDGQECTVKLTLEAPLPTGGKGRQAEHQIEP